MADRKSANLARNSLRIAVVVIEATRRSKTPVYEKGHTRRREQEDDELQVSHPPLGYTNAHHWRGPDSGSLSNVNEFLWILPGLNDPAERVVSSHHLFRVNDMVTRFTGFETGWLGTESRNGGLLAIEARSSPLQMIAQDIFTIFVRRIADILEPLKEAAPRQIQTATTSPLENSLGRPYLGLMKTHVQSIVDKLVAADIGSREDSLMSITSALPQRSRLPVLNDVMVELLSYAKSLRWGSKFQVGEDLLGAVPSRSSAVPS
jgi:hypothetical protein